MRQFALKIVAERKSSRNIHVRNSFPACTKVGVNSEIRRVGVGKAIGGRDRRAGVLHQRRVLRMQERALPFAEKCKTRLVHRSRPDGPGMRDVYLLGSLIGQIAEPRKRGASRLKARERFGQIVLRKIIIARQMLIFCQLMIDLRRELITPLVSQRHSLERTVRTVRIGHVMVQEIQRRLVHARSRNLIVHTVYGIRKYSWRGQCAGIRIVGAAVVGAIRDRKRTAVERVYGRLATRATSQNAGIREYTRKRRSSGKIAKPLCRSRHSYRIRRSTFAQPVAFVGHEEKGFVFLDRPAKRRAKLILQIVQLGTVEKSFCVQALIAEELIQIPMHIVRSGLGYHVHHRAGVASVLRVERVGKHAELLDAVRGWLDGGQVGKLVVSVAAVHRKIVVAAAPAVYADHSRAIAPVNIVHAELRLHTRLQLQQLIGIPLRQRQLAHRARSHHCAQLRRSRIHQRRRSRHFHDFRRAANLQHDIQIQNFVQFHHDALAQVFLESRLTHRHVVSSHRDFQEDVFAVPSGIGIPLQTSCLVDDGHLRGGNRAARRIRHRAANSSAGALRETCRRACGGHKKQHATHKQGLGQNCAEILFYFHDGLTPEPRSFQFAPHLRGCRAP